MKNLVLVLSLIVAMSILLADNSQAMVQLPGTFVATECGETAAAQVCLGQVVGQPDQFLSLVTSENPEPHLFKVVDISFLFIAYQSGQKAAIYFLEDANGHHAKLIALRSPEGFVEKLHGKVAGEEIDVSLERVFHTM